MRWTNVSPRACSESDIQGYMERWHQSVTGWSRVGAPDWLEAMNPMASNHHCATSLGYSFRPDLLATSRNEHLVLEFKCGYKYEPLALAEVLHHAKLLSSNLVPGNPISGATSVVPVLVTQYNSWLRGALAFLRDRGLTESAIKYVEFTTLDADGENVLWFDEPFAGWDVCQNEPPVPDRLKAATKVWRKVSGASTWIGIDAAGYERPALWSIPYVMLSADPRRERLLTWHGSPTGMGRYLLWRSDHGSTESVLV